MTETPQDFVPEPPTPQQIELVIQAMNDSIATIEFEMTQDKSEESSLVVGRNVVHLQGVTHSPIFSEVSAQDKSRCFEAILAGQSW